VTAYTAFIQIGAIAATLIYFFKDFVRFALAWFRGLRNAEARRDPDYGLAWAVIIGSIPVGVVGFLARDIISGPLRSLWVVAAALVIWSIVIVVAERMHTAFERKGQLRGEHSVRPIDGLIIGLVQCFSLIPGVSRSGATISAGLARGIDRVTSTRLSFFLAIPALVAAGLFQAVEEKDGLSALGIGPVLVGLVTAFIVAYATIAWLLRFVANHSLLPFVWYRVILGVVVAVVLGAGWLSAT
jgi:undecaprenyl-diphosphatase